MNSNSKEDLIHRIKVIKIENGKYVLLLEKVPTTLLKEVIDMSRGHKWLNIGINQSDIERLEELEISTNSGDLNMYYYCDTIAEAPVAILTRHGIKEILVGARENNCARKMNILKYSIIRHKLEKIVEDLYGKSDKEKFKSIYRRLANMIDYDHDAIKDGSEYAKLNEEACRNLENAVLLNTCVCQGYCEVLKQTLSLVGIESIICKSIEGEDDTTHTYNIVKLDGEWFNTDLTWDYSSIRRGVRPRYCLKSDKDFLKCSEKDKPYHIPYNIELPRCNVSVELFPEFKKPSSMTRSRTIIFGRVYRDSQYSNRLEEGVPVANKCNFKETIKMDIKSISCKGDQRDSGIENIHANDKEVSK